MQVVAGAGEFAIANPLGTESLNPTSVRSNALLFVNVMVSTDEMLVMTLAGKNASLTVGDVGVVEMAVGQGLVPADVGAVLEALVAVTLMVAVLVAPAESVTVSVTVPLPARIDNRAELAPDTIVTPPVAVQANETMVRLHAAALPLASKMTAAPEVMAGRDTAAIGCSADCTALKALAMPVPHWPDGGHEHSSVLVSKLGHTGRFLVFTGKADALDSRRATSCAGVRL
jgi:hypothetical protein